MRFVLPPNHRVRYDVHQHPRGVSAIVMERDGNIAAVGFAKFNPRDPAFNVQIGMQIALGRALSKMPRRLTRPRDAEQAMDALEAGIARNPRLNRWGRVEALDS